MSIHAHPPGKPCEGREGNDKKGERGKQHRMRACLPAQLYSLSLFSSVRALSLLLLASERARQGDSQESPWAWNVMLEPLTC